MSVILHSRHNLIRLFQVNFGHIKIPENFEPPKEKNLGPLSSHTSGVRSGNVVIKNSKTIRISELHYDGACPGNLHQYFK